jgi:hypothetical protein
LFYFFFRLCRITCSKIEHIPLMFWNFIGCEALLWCKVSNLYKWNLVY